MEFWLLAVTCILVLVIAGLLIKINLLRRAAEEIRIEFIQKLTEDTNTLIGISSRDSKMRKLAEEINRQLRQLRGERRRFQQGDLELKEAVAGISHDLRTPLTAICGYLDLLEREEKPEAVSRYLEIIKNRTEAMKQLTEEFFRYSVATSAPQCQCMETVALNSVLEESISAYYAVLRDKKINPEIILPEKRIIRKLNRNAFSRILENVIGNAVKYSDGDLHIRLSEQGEMIFSNHASGLDEVQVGKLFDRFYTVESAKNSTGLGLSIAKVLTEQMNGRIAAEYHCGMLSIRLSFPEEGESVREYV